MKEVKTIPERLEAIVHKHKVFLTLYNSVTDRNKIKLLSLHTNREKKKLLKLALHG